MRNQFGKSLAEYFKEHADTYFITADAGNGAFMKDFGLEHPERWINVGIAEQSMMSIAAGMAVEGSTVVCNSIGNFPTLRCIEQIRDDVCYHHLNVKVAATGGGLSYGPAGVTHHASEDLSIMRALPGMTCFVPGDPIEVEACVKLMMETEGPCYIRVGYSGEANVHQNKIAELHVGDILPIAECETDRAVFVSGNILREAKAAVDSLKEEGVNVSLYSFPCLKPVNRNQLEDIVKKHPRILTVEENILDGGFGSMVLEQVSDLGLDCKVRRMGLKRFAEEVGSREYLLKKHHLATEDITQTIKEL